MDYLVIKIIDGVSFYISPNWKWGRYEGCRVEVYGLGELQGGDNDDDVATARMENFLLGRDVTLENPREIRNGVLICDVRIDNILLGEHFKKNVLHPASKTVETDRVSLRKTIHK